MELLKYAITNANIKLTDRERGFLEEEFGFDGNFTNLPNNVVSLYDVNEIFLPDIDRIFFKLDKDSAEDSYFHEKTIVMDKDNKEVGYVIANTLFYDPSYEMWMPSDESNLDISTASAASAASKKAAEEKAEKEIREGIYTDYLSEIEAEDLEKYSFHLVQKERFRSIEKRALSLEEAKVVAEALSLEEAKVVAEALSLEEAKVVAEAEAKVVANVNMKRAIYEEISQWQTKAKEIYVVLNIPVWEVPDETKRETKREPEAKREILLLDHSVDWLFHSDLSELPRLYKIPLWTVQQKMLEIFLTQEQRDQANGRLDRALKFAEKRVNRSKENPLANWSFLPYPAFQGYYENLYDTCLLELQMDEMCELSRMLEDLGI